MSVHIILASGSPIRARLLANAGLPVDVIKPRIDEESIKAALKADNASPRDIADCLAESKARKISDKHPSAKVLGCDQVLDAGGALLSKADSPEAAIAQLMDLQGRKHTLLSAAVIYEDRKPIWRHVGKVTMHMRPLSSAYVTAYVERNWESVREAVGAYKLEEEGARLFTRVEGDYFTVLGMPLLDILNFLTLRGDLES